MSIVESAVIKALIDGLERPEAVEAVLQAALAAYNSEEEEADGEQESDKLEAELRSLELKQQSAVRAQIAGIMAGADPQAYNAVFEEIAARRAALEERKAALARTQDRSPLARREWTAKDFSSILSDVRRVLESAELPGDVKRDAIGTLIERVYPLKTGAKVVFRADAFGGEETIHQIKLWNSKLSESF